MAATLIASFDEIQIARKAIADLIRSGASADDITLACKSGQMQVTDMPPFGSKQEPSSTLPAEEASDPDDQEFGAMAGAFPDLRASGPGNSFGDPSTSGAGTRFAGIAASANASIEPGKMTDFLWNSLPVDVARYYQQEFDGGRTVLMVRNPSPQAERILTDLGATHIHSAGFMA